MDSELRNSLFTLLREVNDAEVMKDSQLRDCIDEIDEQILTSRQESAAVQETGLDALLDSVHPEGHAMSEQREYTTRERVAMYIPFIVADHKIKPRALVQANWEMRSHALGMELQGVLLMRADSAIAEHSRCLWEQIDSYDFFDALEAWVSTNDNYEPEGIARFAAEYLLGPNPNEQEVE